MVVADVKSGDILALANYPFFNPNIYGKTSASDRRNRAALDIYEPGSTLKPILFAAALEEAVIEPDTLVDCENGRWRVGRKTIRDHHRARWLPARKVLRYSSNIGSAKIARDLGADAYYSYLVKLGLTEKPSVRLPAMRSGMLRPPSEWTEVDQAAIAFGQGIGTTALQLAQAFMCIASGGETRPLRLVKDPESPAPKPGVRVFSRQTAQTVLKLMEEVVEMDGTGRRARIPGITMAGKTGTAQKAGPGGYGDKYMSSFVGMVPSLDPELLILCMVDEPKGIDYGGIVAAPVAREVFVETLALRGKLPDAQAASALADAETVDEVNPEALPQQAALPAPKVIEPGKRVPDVKGLPLRRALDILLKKGIVPVIEGDGMTVTGQRPAPGAPWPEPAEEAEDDVFILQLS
ncbi:penicillin-binding transpeptidase domain-containing protein [Salidesulfovibrio brasiliensis]|uniref:penicillin-binding transpeptidase domain-containing protein n=1 Tax=Salidesulfovibrio brasiliensis TaxID=221711 RepID=UPI001FE1DC29|nr:penicillin-binding transpeptidase domain-containing protein [Salidesulfovibrio brasiliensis]